MKRTGEILQKAREQKGLSINEIGLSLKIGSKILKAIEDGEMDQLPAKTFLRGFVQSYANYLRLDVNEVLKIFQDEMGSTRPSPLIHMPEQDSTLESFEKNKTTDVPAKPLAPGASSTERPLNSLAKQSNSRTLSLSLLGLVLVGLIVFTKKMIDKYQKEGTVADVEVAAPLPSSSPVVGSTPAEASNNTPTTSAIAVTTPATTTALAPTPVAAAKANATLAPTPSSTPVPTPVATPMSTPTPAPTPAPTPVATPTPVAEAAAIAPKPTPTPTPVGNKPVEVILEALDNVEVTASTSDGKSEKIAMTADQVHTFKSKNGLKINVSNGGAVNVIVNGKDLGIPGNLGKPAKLSF